MVDETLGPHITVAELRQALEGVRDEAVVGLWLPPNFTTPELWTIHPVLLGSSPLDTPVFRLILRQHESEAAFE